MYKLIICDDELRARNQLSKIVDWGSLGYELVATFPNGKAALDYIKINHVDGIIADVRMPVMDGVTLAEIISNDFPETKVILVSAYRDFEYAQKALEYNCIAYITKPIKLSDINQTLEKLFSVLSEKRFSKGFTDIEILKKRSVLFSDTLFLNKENTLLDKEFREMNMSVNTRMCMAGIIDIDLTSLLPADYSNEMLFNIFLNILPTQLPDAYFSIVAHNKSFIKVFAIGKADCEDDTFKMSLENFCTNTLQYLNKILNITPTVRISTITKRIDDIPEDNKVLFSDVSINNLPLAVRDVIEFINNNYSSDISLDEVAANAFMHPVYLSSLLKKYTNDSYIDYLTKVRIEKAKEFLTDTDDKISSIGLKVGYSYSQYFHKIFKSSTGLTPAEYRKKHKK